MPRRGSRYVIIKALIYLGIYSAFNYAYPLIKWPIFSVSESTWEHLKIGFFSAAFLALAELALFALSRINSWARFFSSRFSGIILIPVSLFLFYYLSVALFGKITPPWLEVASVIVITFLSGLATFHTENAFLDFPWEKKPSLLLLQVVMLIIAAYLFITFTYRLPYYPLFKVP